MDGVNHFDSLLHQRAGGGGPEDANRRIPSPSAEWRREVSIRLSNSCVVFGKRA